MSEESISIDETNRIRISLGMKPIPVESTEPQKQMSTHESMSVSETNKLRISLGMRPIEENSAIVDNEQSTEDYVAVQRSKEKEQKMKERLELAKVRAEKRGKVNVAKSLLDEEDEEDDAGDWLSKISSKNPAVKTPKAKKTKKTEHTDQDLAGVKVSHNINDIDSMGGNDVILTLKETDMLDEDDELESELLVQKRKIEKEMDQKLRTNKYDINGREKSQMEIREEEMTNADNDDGFVLTGGEISLTGLPKPKKEANEGSMTESNGKKRLQFSLDDLDEDEDEGPGDYAKSKPVKMKKRKKQVQQSQARKRDITDEDGDTMLRPVTLQNADDDIDDDSELRSRLALKRSQKQKKKTPEQLAAEIEEEKAHAMDVDESAGGVVIDENSEFLAGIKARVEEEENGASGRVLVEEDTEMTEATPMAEPVALIEPEDESKLNFSGGLAATLGFLKGKNAVKDLNKGELEAKRKEQENKKEAELRRIKYDIEKRKFQESLRQEPVFKRMSKEEQSEYLERQTDAYLARQNAKDMEERLKNYNPTVEIKHYDELGRELNEKEAFKHLSHQFHGNGMSKSKTEKKLKKMEEERELKYRESLLGGRGSKQ